jgi:hypothetical protein
MVTLIRFPAVRTAIAMTGAASDSSSKLVGRVDPNETAQDRNYSPC